MDFPGTAAVLSNIKAAVPYAMFTMEFDEDGTLYMSTTAKENDFAYDEIGSHLKIKQYRGKYAELLENLETFYHIFMLQDEEKKKAVLEETNDTSN